MSFFKKLWNSIFCKKKKTTTQETTPAVSTPKTFLEKLKAINGIMLGHHDATLEGYNWLEPIGKSDIYDVLGKYPKFIEFDLLGIELCRTNYTDTITYEDIKNEAIKHHERGGIIGFSWHMFNPYTGHGVTSLNPNTVPTILEENEGAHQRFWNNISLAIDFLKTIVDKDGNQIPFIFRPFHECLNKSTMWWVSNQCTAEQYIELWKQVHAEFKEKFGDNVLFCYSPTSFAISKENYLSRYPGDEYVDIMGIEEYQHQVNENADIEATRQDYVEKVDYNVNLVCKIAKEHDKICALTECGIYINQDPEFWSKAFSSVLNYDIKYFCLWRNANNSKEASGQLCYAPYVGEASEQDFKTFCSNDKIVKI